MRSFGADPAEYNATGIQPALTSLADEVVGTMARLIPYVVALALLAIIGISLLDQLPDTSAIEPSGKGGWSEAPCSAREFAVCYADLDHFKEFNDRYSYYDGDRVIYLLSRILHDVVKGLLAQRGFVGHIGGDDFIFVVPTEEISPVCSEILDVFDTLIPLQYNEQDRRAGYFFGKDRRGQLHRVPLMTLSIGIVTNRHRQFAHPAQVSELATEMKSYAKTLPGTVFVVDRRQGTNGEERSGAGSREQP